MKRVLFPFIMLFLLVACEKDQLAPVESDPDLTVTVEARDVGMAITMTEDLIIRVEDLMDDNAIGNGPGNSILSKLNSIKSKLERGQLRVALSKLHELLIHLEGLVDEGSLDVGIAEGLVFDVETIACEADPDCEPLDMLKATINTGTETYTLYVHPDNQRSSTNGNPVAWGGYRTDTELFNYPTENAARTDFNGFENTQVIVATVDALGETNYAAKVCADLEAGGYSDWYLPALGELMPMLNQLGRYQENNFDNPYYWSSTEASASGAWRPHFNPNYVDHWRVLVAGKYFNSGSCRCVRKWRR